MSLAALPFDSIASVTNGARATISVAQFLDLPLHDRVRLVLEGTTTFLRAGTPVDRRVALAGLRAWATRAPVDRPST